VGCAPVSPALAAGLPLAVAELDHQPPTSRRDFFRAGVLFTSGMPTHTHKSRAWRVLIAFKRASVPCFGLYGRAAARHTRQSRQGSGLASTGSAFVLVLHGALTGRSVAGHGVGFGS
jgi:hypothetical protein